MRKNSEKREEEEKLKEQEKEEEEKMRLKKEEEEKEKKEQEEYEQWKEFLTLEETGTKMEEEKDEENLLQNFISYIKLRKTVTIEDLAMRFNLSNKLCIERLNSLIECNMLKGVIDERGKFLYLEDSEIDGIINKIKSKGVFNKEELIETFSNLIRTQPTEEDSIKIKEEENELLKGVNQDFENMIIDKEEE